MVQWTYTSRSCRVPRNQQGRRQDEIQFLPSLNVLVEFSVQSLIFTDTVIYSTIQPERKIQNENAKQKKKTKKNSKSNPTRKKEPTCQADQPTVRTNNFLLSPIQPERKNQPARQTNRIQNPKSKIQPDHQTDRPTDRPQPANQPTERLETPRQTKEEYNAGKTKGETGETEKELDTVTRYTVTTRRN
jgi:hypothetical protein